MSKYCKDCRHVINTALPGFHKCGRTGYTDPVTGANSFVYCSIERREGFNQCGPEGKFFEAVEPNEVSDER